MNKNLQLDEKINSLVALYESYKDEDRELLVLRMSNKKDFTKVEKLLVKGQMDFDVIGGLENVLTIHVEFIDKNDFPLLFSKVRELIKTYKPNINLFCSVKEDIIGWGIGPITDEERQLGITVLECILEKEEENIYETLAEIIEDVQNQDLDLLHLDGAASSFIHDMISEELECFSDKYPEDKFEIVYQICYDYFEFIFDREFDNI
jgi:hypothetical protein